ncbi:MAG: hypothetical protein HY286_02460 [Planctomycetes bacterium]|nr:hypothetical protein [Planctomycetota bacterium]
MHFRNWDNRRVALAIFAAGSLQISCKSAPPPPHENYKIQAGAFLLETEIADARVRAAAADVLGRADAVLRKHFKRMPAQTLRFTLLASEAERWARAAAPGDDDETLRAVPARASRSTLSAVVAFPRSELIEHNDLIPDLLLPDSVKLALGHEAAHLWIFATIPFERKIPESIHEGIAEWISECVDGENDRRGAMWRESVPELLRARERDEVPTIDEFLRISPKESRSPQLWTSLAWWIVRQLTYDRDKTILQALNDDVAPSFAENSSLRKSLAFWEERGLTLGGLGGLLWGSDTPPDWWTIGRDVSVLPGDGAFAPGFLLAPIPGAGVWLFRYNSKTSFKCIIEFDATLLGGGSPELWIGFGFDDGSNGVRVLIPRSGRVTVERVVDGQPQYAREAQLGERIPREGEAVHVRVSRAAEEVKVDVGTRSVTLPFPTGAMAISGHLGVGARGGAFAIRALSIQSGDR